MEVPAAVYCGYTHGDEKPSQKKGEVRLFVLNKTRVDSGQILLDINAG